MKCFDLIKKGCYKLFVHPKSATSFTLSDQWASHLAALSVILLLFPITRDILRTSEEREEHMQNLTKLHPLMPYNPIDNPHTRLIVILAANLTIKYKNRQKRLYLEAMSRQNNAE